MEIQLFENELVTWKLFMQLFMARQLIAQLLMRAGQGVSVLTIEELNLRKDLNLASLARTIARQRSWIRVLQEGGANIIFFHLQACRRN